MLTKDLLIHRRVKDRIHPHRLDPSAAELVDLASRLAAVLESAVGQTRGEIAEALTLESTGFHKPKVAKGLAKLVLDRLELEEPSLEVGADRLELMKLAAGCLRSLDGSAAPADYERTLSAQVDLAAARKDLYADLPGARMVERVRPLTAEALVHRYNLAQVQGLVLHADCVSVTVPSSHVLELRRVLRWLKFCRLVSRVEPQDEGFLLEVEGPGLVVGASKKYGLQLAEFVAVVPVLPQFVLQAEVRLRGARPKELLIDEKFGLVSPHIKALGHVPEELRQAAERLAEHPVWRMDPDPAPRHVGAKEMCVPDLAFEHRETGVRYDVELFHRWHKAAFTRRLEQLATRRDTSLLLGVDRSIKVDEKRLLGAKVFRFKDYVRFESFEALLEG